MKDTEPVCNGFKLERLTVTAKPSRVPATRMVFPALSLGTKTMLVKGSVAFVL